MKRSFISRVAPVICSLGLAVLLGLGAVLGVPAQASAQSGTPHVTVYLKNYHAEYDLATAKFLEQQFDFTDSPAYGLVTYDVLTTDLTLQALANSTALIIDESADMALNSAEAAVVHQFIKRGGKVAVFAFPRYYWDHEGPNPAAYQGIADLWGITAVGEPAASEVASGDSSADILEPEDNTVSFTEPYTQTTGLVQNYDQMPFSPITATRAKSVLTSAALGQAPVAVGNRNGVFVTCSLGDAIQGADANKTYAEFVTNVVVGLAQNGALQNFPLYLPVVGPPTR